MLRFVLLAAFAAASVSISHAVPIGEIGSGASQPGEAVQDQLELAQAEQPAGCPPLYQNPTIDEVAALIQDAGYSAQVKSDDQGQYIASKASGLNFEVYFYGCEGEPQRCRQLQFRASFTTTAEQQQKAVQFNADKVFGRAYNVSESTYVEHPMHLNGGVTVENIANNIDLWDGVLGGFADYIGW